jgi:hypothetical protein
MVAEDQMGVQDLMVIIVYLFDIEKIHNKFELTIEKTVNNLLFL